MSNQEINRLADLREKFRKAVQQKENTMSLEERDELKTLCQKEKKGEIARFGKDYDWLLELLHRHDLAEIKDVPLDEYDGEARIMLRWLFSVEEPSHRQITDKLAETFAVMFSPRGQDSDTVWRENTKNPKFIKAGREIFNHFK